MGYYPVFLEMNQRRCVVVGGGAVTERKVAGLVAAGADVTVISPAVSEGLRELLTTGAVRHIAREYRSGDLKGFELVFVATDDAAVNAAVYRDARAYGVWVNAADDPAHCDFILPSVLRRGALTVAVSTGGASPALARMVREELESSFSRDYEVVAELAAEVREELRARGIAPDYERWRQALTGEFKQRLARGERRQAKDFLLSELGAMSCK